MKIKNKLRQKNALLKKKRHNLVSYVEGFISLFPVLIETRLTKLYKTNKAGKTNVLPTLLIYFNEIYFFTKTIFSFPLLIISL